MAITLFDQFEAELRAARTDQEVRVELRNGSPLVDEIMQNLKAEKTNRTKD